MFKGSSNNFTICIKDIENIPNIFNLIYNKINRDCSDNCYGEGKSRISTVDKKRCCPFYVFNNNCFNKCPGKTKNISGSNVCKIINCTYLYNFEQDGCIDKIPDGYYQNDTNERTIDRCNEDCKTCYGGPNDISKRCLKCKDHNLYVYLGNCFKSCRYGYFNDSNGTKICKCHRIKCRECTEESLKYNLCVSCNKAEGYYEMLNDKNNMSDFIDCIREKEGYYYDNNSEKYKPCYPSCKYCYKNEEDKMNHYCISCNEENSFSIIVTNNFTNMSCFPECKYYYYFNQTNDYICTKNSYCPPSYPFLLENTKRCIQSCNEKNKYHFRHTCFEQCPYDSFNYTNGIDFYCNASCPLEKPFEMTETQYCVSSCTIMERHEKLCFTNYDGNRSSEVQDMVLNDFREDFTNTFDYTIISETHNLIHEEKNVII
jgi:hypothetical protein